MNALRGVTLVLLVALMALATRWAIEHHDSAPSADAVTRDPRLSFAHAAHLGRSALEAYRRLPAAEQDRLRKALEENLWTLSRWSATIRERGPRFLCLGERHRDAVRRFLAASVLPRLPLEVMMLEADLSWVRAALEAHAAGEPVPHLLDATMTPIFDALATFHSSADIIGVDESALERRARRSLSRADLSRLAREDTILTNLRRRWQPGKRHVVLFGALHCRDLPQWLFARLPRESDVVDRAQSLNTVVLARYQEPAIQLLMYLLEEMGLRGSAWVVPDTTRFPQRLLQWLPNVTDAFATYDSAILFDDRARAGDTAALIDSYR